MDHQQWEPVILRNPNGVKSAGTRVTPNTNPKSKHHVSEKAHVERKLDQDTDVPQLKRICPDTRKKIVAARTSKKWNRDQLAKAINEKTNVVKEFEEGNAVLNNSILNKMERALGTKLR